MTTKGIKISKSPTAKARFYAKERLKAEARAKEEGLADEQNLALVFDPNGGGQDYTLADDHDSAWITVGNLSVYLIRTGTGVRVELYPHYHEACCEAEASCELDDAAKERADDDHQGGD